VNERDVGENLFVVALPRLKNRESSENYTGLVLSVSSKTDKIEPNFDF
jgi:hypothetical protein